MEVDQDNLNLRTGIAVAYFMSFAQITCFCRSLVGLELFPHLEEVILDSNGLTDSAIQSLPHLHKVQSLSLNKNKISFCSAEV